MLVLHTPHPPLTAEVTATILLYCNRTSCTPHNCLPEMQAHARVAEYTKSEHACSKRTTRSATLRRLCTHDQKARSAYCSTTPRRRPPGENNRNFSNENSPSLSLSLAHVHTATDGFGNKSPKNRKIKIGSSVAFKGKDRTTRRKANTYTMKEQTEVTRKSMYAYVRLFFRLSRVIWTFPPLFFCAITWFGGKKTGKRNGVIFY